MKRLSGFMIVLLVSSLLGAILWAQTPGQDGEVDRSQLRIKGKIYTLENRYEMVSVSDESGAVVFQVNTEEPDSFIAGVDHSDQFDTFVAFKILWQSRNNTYQLNIQTQSFDRPVIMNSETPFYTPVLIEHQRSSCVAYISESFSIHVRDLATGEMRNIIQFQTPLYDLKKNIESDLLSFLLYREGKYREFALKLTDLLSPEPQVFPVHQESGHLMLPDDRNTGSDGVNNVNGLDYRKFLGFGDSITKGWVDGQEAPELGYIPRLDLRLDMFLYESEVINEGYPATKTTDAILIFDAMIELHQAKYLLFHYGTNDVIKINKIPVSLTLFNITEMMTKALDFGMIPVLSTLIPRDPAHKFGQGIFKNRAVKISDGIEEIGQTLNIPVIDFYTIFGEFPDKKGGYYFLMSDRNHPSQAGYSLMAWEWYYVLIAIAPAVPDAILLTPLSPYTVEVSWQTNTEPNFYYYLIEYGYDPLDLNQQIKSWSNSHIFNSEPFIPQNKPRIYFRIRAVNNLGVMSAFSPVNVIEFGE